MRLFSDLKGYYQPAFFYINVGEYIDFNRFEENTVETKGTFIHEYCHFLQDVTTTHGYYNFIYYIQELINRLFPESYENEKRLLELNSIFYAIHNGDIELEDSIIFINDVNIRQEDFFNEEELGTYNKCVFVKYNGNKEFAFGNYCIMESMAYLVEKQLYDISNRYDEFPYNMCEEICKIEYEAFAKNDIYILALCELALLERNSAVFFIEALRLMKNNNFMPQNVKELENYICKHFDVEFRGNKDNIISLLDAVYPNSKFDLIKEWIVTRYELGCKYREKSKCFIALALSDKDKKVCYGFWQQIMDDFGCPNVVDELGNLSCGAYLRDKQVDIEYMLAPMVINELILTNNHSCPLSTICKGNNSIMYSEECERNLFNKNAKDYFCPITLFCKIYSIKMQADSIGI